MCNYLRSHWISYTISVDKDMVRKLTVIVIAESLKSTFEILLKDSWTNDFLTFLALRTSLCIIFTHMFIVSCTETNDTLLSFMAHIDAYKHRFFWYFFSEIKSPEISSKLCVNLSENVNINSVIILLNCFCWNELRYNRAISVNFIFQSSIEVFLFDRIRHYNQKEVNIIGFFWFWKLSSICIFTAHIF